MAKRNKREWDGVRTELLDLPELLVEKGKGSRNYFYAWNSDPDVEVCPLCGSDVTVAYVHFAKLQFKMLQAVVDSKQRHDSAHTDGQKDVPDLMEV